MTATTILSPFTLENGKTCKNRLWLAPMTNGQSHEDGSLGDDELRWIERRADGGFGAIETCAVHVSRDGQGWPGELGAFEDRLIPGLTKLASAISARGALGIVQLFHGGARANPDLTGERCWSASEIPSDPAAPRAATREDIARTIAAFRDAAKRTHEAGFDGVELHGAHGYLIGQFLSNQNTRTDEYGGDFAGRARIAREIVRAVRAVVPSSFTVGIRISPEEWGQAKGVDLDESLELARWLTEEGIDFLHLSLWKALDNTKKRPESHAIPLFREAVGEGVKIVAAGNVWTRAEAQSVLDLGADAVALGRAAIANPDFPKAIEDAGWEPKRPPLTAAELSDRALSDTFIGYMRRWKGFVAD